MNAADWDTPEAPGRISLKELLTGQSEVRLAVDPANETVSLTPNGIAQGPLVGGNLDMIATAAGWALPNLDGCILLIEAVHMYLGQIDRQLAMLIKGGFLNGVAGIALGQFTGIKPSGALTIIDLLREYLSPMGGPILGGLPLGHDVGAQRIPMGFPTTLDAGHGILTVNQSR